MCGRVRYGGGWGGDGVVRCELALREEMLSELLLRCLVKESMKLVVRAVWYESRG